MGAASSGQDGVDPRFVTERHVVRAPAEPMETIPLDDPSEPEPTSSLKLCAACAHTMGRDSVICTHCGYDERQGFTRATSPGSTHAGGGTIACPYCDYDLTGLKQLRCPECGNVIDVADLKATPTLAKVKVPVQWHELVRPAIIFAVALAIVSVIFLLDKGSTPIDLIKYYIVQAVVVPCGLLAYWLIGVIWMGFDQSLVSVTVRLAMVFVVYDAIMLLGSLILGGWLVLLLWPVAMVAYVLLLQKELDIEITDAIYIAGATFMIKLLVGGPVLGAIFGALGI
ncbi:MAG: hypothetical protein ACREJO_05575 [Phycisphaerales bacterium]